MKILADDRTFRLVFAFPALAITIRMYYRNLENCNTTVWMLNRNRNFKLGQFHAKRLDY